MCFCLWWKTYNAIEGAKSWDNYYDDGYDDFGHENDNCYNSDNYSPPTTTELTLSIVRLDDSQMNNNTNSSSDQIEDPSMIIANLVQETFTEFSCLSPKEARTYHHHNHLLQQHSYQDDDTTTQQQQQKQQSYCETMKKTILEYRNNTDKWVGFTSILLKSLAYHRSIDQISNKLAQYHDNSDNTNNNNNSSIIGRQASQQQQSYYTTPLPIVDLPRTKYNRPYLPNVTYNSRMSNNASSSLHNNNNNNSSSSSRGVDENWYSCMNITHQYPWICMVQQQQQQQQRKNQSMLNDNTQRVVGVDVVTFHINLNTYTPTVQDFLSSLSHCFTTWEWNRIMNTTTTKQQHCATTNKYILPSKQQQQQQRLRSETSSIYEFYLRWAMKEAYTKAIGLGMEINFHDVEIRLFDIDINDGIDTVKNCATTTIIGTEREEDDDSDDDEEEGIWTTIQQHVCTSSSSTTNQQQLSVIGKVKRKQCDTSIQISTWEVWEFIFVPLYNNTTTDVDNDDDSDDDNDDDDDSIDSLPNFLSYIDDDKDDDDRDDNDVDDAGSDTDNDDTTTNQIDDYKSMVDLLSPDTAGLTPPENTTSATTMVGMEACACICRGPLPANTTSYGINHHKRYAKKEDHNLSPPATATTTANLEYLTLTKLIQFHRMGGEGDNMTTQQAQTINNGSSTLFVNDTETSEMYDTASTTTNTNSLSAMEQLSNMFDSGKMMNDLDHQGDGSGDKVNLSSSGILSSMLSLGSNSVSKMGNAVMERGSKLTTLAEKTQSFEAASLDFANMAKELNQRQNSWW